jgi:hypothetical protein
MFTLDMPSYVPVLQHSKNRKLREEMYRAYLTRASEGEVDNTPIIEKILVLKKEKAQLLGFENHAEVSLVTKMATLDKAKGLLEELRAASWDAAVKVCICYFLYRFVKDLPFPWYLWIWRALLRVWVPLRTKMAILEKAKGLPEAPRGIRAI